MKLLNTYDDRDEAEAAAERITGEKRLASERDSTVVIYNLFDEEFFGSLGSSTNAITTNGVTGFSPNLFLGTPRSMSFSVIARF